MNVRTALSSPTLASGQQTRAEHRRIRRTSHRDRQRARRRRELGDCLTESKADSLDCASEVTSLFIMQSCGVTLTIRARRPLPLPLATPTVHTLIHLADLWILWQRYSHSTRSTTASCWKTTRLTRSLSTCVHPSLPLAFAPPHIRSLLLLSLLWVGGWSAVRGASDEGMGEVREEG